MIDVLMPLLSDIAAVGNTMYEYYRGNVQVSVKSDKTLVTNVDHMAHESLCQSLNYFFPDVPIISEEGAIPAHEERKKLANYWLLDPLDGTVDFINETDEFVISLAYMSQHQPTMGMLHHPVSGKTWVGIKNAGVFVYQEGHPIQPIAPPPKNDNHVILVSSHRNDEALCNVIVRQRERELGCSVQVKPLGSALKFAYLAEGIGDEYVRFTPTNDWDVAAGHLLVSEAGFQVMALNPSERIEYGSATMKIPPISIRRLPGVQLG